MHTNSQAIDFMNRVRLSATRHETIDPQVRKMNFTIDRNQTIRADQRTAIEQFAAIVLLEQPEGNKLVASFTNCGQ